MIPNVLMARCASMRTKKSFPPIFKLETRAMIKTFTRYSNHLKQETMRLVFQYHNQMLSTIGFLSDLGLRGGREFGDLGLGHVLLRLLQLSVHPPKGALISAHRLHGDVINVAASKIVGAFAGIHQRRAQIIESV